MTLAASSCQIPRTLNLKGCKGLSRFVLVSPRTVSTERVEHTQPAVAATTVAMF